MPEAKFVLKEPKASEKTLVYLFFNFNNYRLKYSTGEKVHPKFWNKAKQRAKETIQFPEYPEFNTRLSNIEVAVKNSYRRLLNDGIIPTPESLKGELNKALGIVKRDQKQSFFEFTNSFIVSVSHLRAKNSLKIYHTTLNHLKDFAKTKGYRIDFDTINLEFYNNFVEYLSKEKGLLTNSIGKYIKAIKAVLNEATERGVNSNIEFKSRKFKSLQEEIDHVYLTTEEIDALYKLSLDGKKYLERVRDLFVIGCHTGLRFSDFSHLTNENFIKDRGCHFFQVRTHKTKEKVVVPIKPTVLEIWNKYDGQLPRAISNQKMNDYLKELGELAGLNKAVIIKKTSGNEVRQMKFKKHELISTHTARRSFATNAYREGVPSLSIMKITGHRTEKAFMRYIKISQEENAALLVSHPFFTEEKLITLNS